MALGTSQVADYDVTIDITCERTDEELERWRLGVHGAIAAAYAKKVEDYEAKLAAREFEVDAVRILGGNSDQNRRIEQTEIKKACIALLSGVDLPSQRFDGIVEDDPYPTSPSEKADSFPRPRPAGDLQEQGRFIRFFEQAFEWEQMSYLFYPYFWGRKKTWHDRALRDHDDPLFAEFLRAGSARAVIPVRPSFEGDLRYFLLTGGLWGGSDMPDISDQNYLPITEEMKERSGASGKERAEGESWEVRLPTKLVKLREDGKLPAWEWSEATGWRPVPKKPSAVV